MLSNINNKKNLISELFLLPFKFTKKKKKRSMEEISIINE